MALTFAFQIATVRARNDAVIHTSLGPSRKAFSGTPGACDNSIQNNFGTQICDTLPLQCGSGHAVCTMTAESGLWG